MGSPVDYVWIFPAHHFLTHRLIDSFDSIRFIQSRDSIEIFHVAPIKNKPANGFHLFLRKSTVRTLFCGVCGDVPYIGQTCEVTREF